jgi:hypothetical protein
LGCRGDGEWKALFVDVGLKFKGKRRLRMGTGLGFAFKCCEMDWALVHCLEAHSWVWSDRMLCIERHCTALESRYSGIEYRVDASRRNILLKGFQYMGSILHSKNTLVSVARLTSPLDVLLALTG